jgi:nitroreductase
LETENEMDVAEAIKSRRSIRSFAKTPVEREKIALVLEAARLAPSAWNKQDWRFVVVRNKETLKKLSLACDDQVHVAEADTVICCCGTNPNEFMSGGEKAYRIDLSIAASFMILQAVELGLGTCWIGAYNRDKVKTLLRVPDGVRVVSLIAIGYPHYVPAPTERKPLREVAAAENFNQPFE